jgi:hypothetical protein
MAGAVYCTPVNPPGNEVVVIESGAPMTICRLVEAVR